MFVSLLGPLGPFSTMLMVNILDIFPEVLVEGNYMDPCHPGDDPLVVQLAYFMQVLGFLHVCLSPQLYPPSIECRVLVSFDLVDFLSLLGIVPL